MLFYAKRHPALELMAALLMGGLGWLGIRASGLRPVVVADPLVLMWGVLGAALLTGWTLAVQRGYALAKGEAYADALTRSLARYFERASVLQVLLAAIAASGEEIFFRGFVQGRFGLVAGSLAFMACHIGGKDIRVIGYWSVCQGLWLGALYAVSGNLLAPILAHGLFDLAAMAYLHRLMQEVPAG